MKNSTFIINKVDSYIHELDKNVHCGQKDAFIRVATKVKEYVFNVIYLDAIDSESILDTIYRYMDHEFSKENIAVNKENQKALAFTKEFRKKVGMIITESMHYDRKQEIRNQKISKDIKNVLVKNEYLGLTIRGIIWVLEKNEDYIDLNHINTILAFIGNNISNQKESLRHLASLRILLNLITKIIDESAFEDQLDGNTLRSLMSGIEKIPDVPKNIFEVILNKIKKSDITFNKADAFGIISSIGGAENVSPIFPEIIIDRTDKETSISSTRTFSLGVYGLKNLKDIPQNMTDIMLEIMGDKEKKFNNVDIKQILIGIFAALINHPLNADLKKIAHDAIGHLKKDKYHGMRKFEIIPLVKILNLYKYFIIPEMHIDETLISEYNKAIRTITAEFESGYERIAYDYLKKNRPRVNMDNNYFIDGIELDIYFPEYKINLEIDGKQHALSGSRDALRDKYLAEKHGIRTVRIPVGKNENLIKRLDAFLIAKMI